MDISIVAIIISGIAAITAIAALIVSVVQHNHNHKHMFYSKFEESISEILFNTLPKAINAFIEENKQAIHKDKYQKVDSCFSALYQSTTCLNCLEEQEYELLFKAVTDLEDVLMGLKEKGFNKSRIEKMNDCKKALYKQFKTFCLSH